MDEERNRLSLSKDALVGIPIAGTALAISYGVGFFYGVGIDYFSFFSLNEHIVFSLQAIPFAFIYVLLSRWFFGFHGRKSIIARYSDQHSSGHSLSLTLPWQRSFPFC